MKKATIAFFVASLAAAWAAGNAKAGKVVYTHNCENCHGAAGEGNPKIAKMLNVSMRPLGSAAVQAMSDQQLKDVVLKGMGKMPAVRHVSDTEATDVVAYIRTLKK
jgi:mono/diheme cytochrome c family protein